MMNEEVIKKYVEDLDGLLEEMSKVKLTEASICENSVIFLFGRIFRFLNFDDVMIGHEKASDLKLDAWAWDDAENRETVIEFEARSGNFLKDKHDPNKCDLIVCWEHNWEDCPSNIDLLELKYFWEKANPS